MKLVQGPNLPEHVTLLAPNVAGCQMLEWTDDLNSRRHLCPGSTTLELAIAAGWVVEEVNPRRYTHWHRLLPTPSLTGCSLPLVDGITVTFRPESVTCDGCLHALNAVGIDTPAAPLYPPDPSRVKPGEATTGNRYATVSFDD